MPSARVAGEGCLRVGFASASPYYNINLVSQPFSHLETALNYRIYRGVDDPILSPYGFGDFSDRGLSIKFALALPEDSDYLLPGIAIGCDDFIGTQGFNSTYIVATQVWPCFDLEASVGYGSKRINGWFGGTMWMPFRRWCMPWLKPLALCAEYDATHYENPEVERHPLGRTFKSRVNYGIKYRLWDMIDFNISSLKGQDIAWSISASVDLGAPLRVVPLLDDPLPYTSPVNIQPLGCLRTPSVLAQDIVYTFRHQGIEVWEIGLYDNACGEKELRLWVSSCRWMYECDMYERLQELVLALTPHDIDVVVITVETEGMPIQEYRFRQEVLDMARCKDICRYELKILSPDLEASTPCCENYDVLYKTAHPWYNLWIKPKTLYLFGSSQGKFKYGVGVSVGSDGFIADQLFYRFNLGYIAKSSLPKSTQDLLNPSQLPNVHTDILSYYANREITIDEFLLQKNWNLGCGWYSRCGGGYFSQFYGGVVGEFLYYPVGSPWAIGFEYAQLYKRNFKGLGFSSTIRKLDGRIPTYIPFDGKQYFLDCYYDWCEVNLDFRLSLGRFLAGDQGGRILVGRNYESGLRLFAWFTYTDGHDKINGSTYYDKGVGFEIPLDLFMTRSSCEKWSNTISAWLRDVGYRTDTGDGLYQLIHQKRL